MMAAALAEAVGRVKMGAGPAWRRYSLWGWTTSTRSLGGFSATWRTPNTQWFGTRKAGEGC